jgi:hypothetical protein
MAHAGLLAVSRPARWASAPSAPSTTRGSCATSRHRGLWTA